MLAQKVEEHNHYVEWEIYLLVNGQIDHLSEFCIAIKTAVIRNIGYSTVLDLFQKILRHGDLIVNEKRTAFYVYMHIKFIMQHTNALLLFNLYKDKYIFFTYY